MGYSDAVGYLYSLQKHGIKLGLENPTRLLFLLGNPEGTFKSIHVAGTNGKGSTSAIAASVLNSAGMRVGLFSSPHLVSFTERIRVNNVEITEQEVVELTDEIREKIEGFESPPTFFEFVTAMGFLYFKRRCVDWALIETGMGGRLDATNVIKPEASIITSISHDHKEFLGEDIRQIAYEKAGIIKYKTPVISASQEPEALDVISKKASAMDAPLYVEGRDFHSVLKKQTENGIYLDYSDERQSIRDLFLPLRGGYQAKNASLAIKAIEVIGMGHCPIREGLSNVKWPGRLEFISTSPPILIDGAHNPSAAEALAQALGTVSPSLTRGSVPPIILIIGIMADKDIKGILNPLLPIASHIIFTAPAYERAAPPLKLQRQAKSLGYKSKTADSVKEALDMAMQMSGLIVVTGSFYTIGEAKEAMGAKGIMTGLRE